MKKFLVVSILFLAGQVYAQTFMENKPEYFDRQDLGIKGRIRQLSLEQVFAGKEKEVVVLSRDGEFPNWEGILSVWKMGKTRRMEKIAEWSMPKETILYGFIPNEQNNAELILVLPNKVQIGTWNGNQWVFDSNLSMPIRSFSEISYGSLAQPFDPLVHFPGEPSWFWVPTLDGYQIFSVQKKKIVAKHLIPLQPKSFYHSSHDLLPFEFQYWFRNIYWFPKVEVGATGTGKKPTFFAPWMDEISMIEFSPTKMQEKNHYFKLLTENERDDGIHYIVNRPVDLNGDGQTDFLINKFMGTGTAFRAQNYYYITGKDGVIPSTGKPIKMDPKKASGALVVDLDRDNKQDFIVVSAMFNVWAMVRALMKKQVLMEFDFYKFKNDSKPYDFNRSDFHQEVLFDFHLGDLFIDGILPTLDGDFNGDGYPDVFYARNRESLSFMIQDPKSASIFPSQPSAVFPFKVPRKYRVGDLNGDGKDDLIFFNTRENKNKSFTVLTNKGLIR